MSEPLTLDELRELHDSVLWTGLPATRKELETLRAALRELIAIRETLGAMPGRFEEFVEQLHALRARHERLRKAAEPFGEANWWDGNEGGKGSLDIDDDEIEALRAALAEEQP